MIIKGFKFEDSESKLSVSTWLAMVRLVKFPRCLSENPSFLEGREKVGGEDFSEASSQRKLFLNDSIFSIENFVIVILELE